MDECRLGTAQKLWTCIFFFPKPRGDKKGYATLQGLADYKHLVEVQVSTNEFLRIPCSSRTETLEQLQQFLQATFEKERAPWAATEKGICESVLNDGRECVDRKDGRNGRARYTSTLKMQIRRMEDEKTVWIARQCTKLDFWTDWLTSLMDLDDHFQHLL